MTMSMTELYNYELPIIRSLQESADEHDFGWFLRLATRVGDNQAVFSVFFPLLAAVSRADGVRFLAAVVASEWANLIMKSLLHGERPYWYVHELHLLRGSPPAGGFARDGAQRAVFDAVHPRYFKQNELTCETGPGLPSGHVMINCVLWSAVVDVLTNKIFARYLGSDSIFGKALERLCWHFLVVMVFLVGVSRVYNLNHFPHQCVAGVVAGAVVVRAVYMNRAVWSGGRQWSAAAYAVFIAAVFVTPFAINFGLQALDMNPYLSLEKSRRWCEQRAWVHFQTNPLYSFSRLAGAALALLRFTADAEERSPDGSDADAETPLPQQVVGAGLGVAVGLAISHVHKLATNSYPQFMLPLSMALHGAEVWAVLTVLPRFARMLTGATSSGKLSRREAKKQKKAK